MIIIIQMTVAAAEISFNIHNFSFPECFYPYARSGQINTMDELTVIMHLLGMSSTIAEPTGRTRAAR